MTAKIKLNAASGGGSVSIVAPTSTTSNANIELKLPTADGGADQVIKTDGSGNLSFGKGTAAKNLITNGAMLVAQRGTSSTTGGKSTVDMFSYGAAAGTGDEDPTQSQVDLVSGNAPYLSGFRKAYRATNGNQTSGVQANSLQQFSTRIEAQDMANSGWNYTDPNSKITFSFWCKSSVAQNFYGLINTVDGTSQQYPFETGTLQANTWTKITKVIPGNSNLQFDNNNGVGLRIYLATYFGTDYTDSSISLNAWGAYSGSARTPDFPSSAWFTTNDATFEITGVQLEVGSSASEFNHETFAETLRKCQRYYYQVVSTGLVSITPSILNMSMYNSTTAYGHIVLPVEMRTNPSLDQATGTGYFRVFGNNGNDDVTQFSLNRSYKTGCELSITASRGQGNSVWVRINNDAAKLAFSADL